MSVKIRKMNRQKIDPITEDEIDKVIADMKTKQKEKQIVNPKLIKKDWMRYG
jgi:hypothetical protein